MVLDDLGGNTAKSTDIIDRQAFLAALGTLHGETLHGCFAGNRQIVLPMASLNEPPYTDWLHALATALHHPQFEIEPWVPNLYNQSIEQLQREPRVLLHGDTDWSNAVKIDSGVALIDWERTQLGPAGLDIGRPAEVMESHEELKAYHAAFCHASKQAYPIETVRRWIMLGECINCVRWVSYFITATFTHQEPGEDWRERYFTPALQRLQQLHACML